MTLADLRHDDIAIDHLRVIAPAGSADQVQRALTLTSWPRAPGNSWVFIREVHAKATGNQLARTLSEETRSLLERPTGPDNGLVMRFDSFEALLVSLLSDLARGRASRRWYWQRWSHLLRLPIGKALTDVMESHIDYLPTVTAGLARTGSLASVWQHLDPAQALRLTAIIAQRNGFDLQTKAQNAEEEKSAPLAILQLPRAQYERWETILKNLPRQDPRRNLALLLIGQESVPLFLQKAPLRLMDALNHAFTRSQPQRQPSQEITTAGINLPPLSPQADQDSQAYSVPPQAPATDAPRHGSSPASDAHVRMPADLPEENKELPATDRPTDPQPASSTADTTASHQAPPLPEAIKQHPRNTLLAKKGDDAPLPTAHEETAPPDRMPPATREQIRLEAPPSPKPLDNFPTAQGGLFFLLNFLKREDAQHLIRQNHSDTEIANDFTSGWGWLYRLGQELALDETDPMTTFLASQLGLQSTPQLRPLPPLPAREHLLNLARRLYDRFGLWHPELLQLNATVHFTPSHVDLYAPLNSVRLPVRLAGLDLNPGWLPWLARVVTFHYEYRTKYV